MRLIYLDDYTLGDPLFLNQLSRTMVKVKTPTILAHGARERLNRRLEAAGHLPGIDAEPNPEALADEVERAHREENRTIVHALNEAHVSVVGVLAAQRRMLHIVGDLPEAGDVAWLISLASSGVVPVVSLAASSEVGWQDGEAWQLMAALAAAMQVASGHCSVLHFRGATQMDVLREALPPTVDIREVTLSALTA
ncbi:hypothetical protein BH23BAC4_BH23BAC4_12990 [soil metagenome]